MKKTGLIFIVFLIISCGRSSEEKGKEAALIDSLKTEVIELQRANDTLSEHLMQRVYVTKNYPSYFDSIANPEEFLLEQLQQKPSLIPRDAVLGGTMRFTQVDFINDELFIAIYEDGHVMGKAVYSYSMNRSGELQFRLIGTVR